MRNPSYIPSYHPCIDRFSMKLLPSSELGVPPWLWKPSRISYTVPKQVVVYGIPWHFPTGIPKKNHAMPCPKPRWLLVNHGSLVACGFTWENRRFSQGIWEKNRVKGQVNHDCWLGYDWQCIPGWWFQTWLLFSVIYGIILPIIFFKIVKTTNDPVLKELWCCTFWELMKRNEKDPSTNDKRVLISIADDFHAWSYLHVVCRISVIVRYW